MVFRNCFNLGALINLTFTALLFGAGNQSVKILCCMLGSVCVPFSVSILRIALCLQKDGCVLTWL